MSSNQRVIFGTVGRQMELDHNGLADNGHMILKPHFLLGGLVKKVICLNFANSRHRAERINPLRLDAPLIVQSAA